jgi:hypothetical protein
MIAKGGKTMTTTDITTPSISPLNHMVLNRSTERGEITEWHLDTDGRLYVSRTLVIPPEGIEYFCLGMMVAS